MDSTVGRVGRAAYKAGPAASQEETPRQAGMRGSPTPSNPGTSDKVSASSQQVLNRTPYHSVLGTFSGGSI